MDESPLCECGQEAITRVSGPNTSRPNTAFFTCPTGKDKGGCRYFCWCDQVHNPKKRPRPSPTPTAVPAPKPTSTYVAAPVANVPSDVNPSSTMALKLLERYLEQQTTSEGHILELLDGLVGRLERMDEQLSVISCRTETLIDSKHI